ncbi:MAG: hypothetical protein LBG27_08780, partial [Spirochaetaceae bacterium]|nr:hypothetical protein [Spirochaetaceae bacterium]
GTGNGDTAADSTGTAEPRSDKKRISEKTAFSSQSQIKLLTGGLYHPVNLLTGGDFPFSIPKSIYSHLTLHA